MTVDVMSGAAWVVWEPLTAGDLLTAGLTAVLGLAALTLAAVGLYQMRRASAARDRQLDAQTETLAALTRMVDERTAALTRSLEAAMSMLDERTAALTRGLETVIRQTGKEGTA